MAGFFSLGSGSGSGSGNALLRDQSHNNNNNNDDNNNNSWNSGLLLYRNEEVYQKGFEIWQQFVQVHHQHPKSMQDTQHHHQFLLHHNNGAPPGMVGPVARTMSGYPRSMMRSSTSGLGGGGGGVNCQDCGNQSKKDCSHSRCRTCCRSRGFDCTTHVKSTWVPAAQRRERQQRLASLQQQPQPPPQQLEMVGRMKGEGCHDNNHHQKQKRQREDKDLACISTGLELGQHFPVEVSAPAMFRCVRVHSTDAADEQLAYQTAVNIGGRIFKGILYDQGPDRRHTRTQGGGDTSPGGEGGVGVATLQHHNLLTSTATTTTNASAPESQGGAAALLDPNNSSMYPPAISAFLAGTQFFPPPRS